MPIHKKALNRLLISIILKSLRKSLILVLPLVTLTACHSLFLPRLQDKNEPSTGVKHEFVLREKQSVFGQLGEVEIESDDSLPLIARYFGLGFDEITTANPAIDPWIPESGHTVKLPSRFILPEAARKGLVLNLAAKRLFYFPENRGNKVITFPIGIGREGWQTPTGKTRVVAKKEHPQWVVPKSIRREHAKKGDPLPKVVAAGPNNPLGDYAIRLGIPGYLIHGTNKPYGVGMAVSHGCVRLYPEDIALLFPQVTIRTPVRLLHQPYLTGWDKGELYIQVYPPTHINKKQNHKLLLAFKKKLEQVERNSKRHIDWNKVASAITHNNGIPIPIFTDSINNESVTKFNHPPYLNHQIKPAPLVNESWRIRVAEFSEADSAQRLAAMLNHQGPPIPAHVLSGNTKFIVVAGPFNSVKKAKASIARLRIDFALNPELIERGVNIPDIQETRSVFSKMLSFMD